MMHWFEVPLADVEWLPQELRVDHNIEVTSICPCGDRYPPGHLALRLLGQWWPYKVSMFAEYRDDYITDIWSKLDFEIDGRLEIDDLPSDENERSVLLTKTYGVFRHFADVVGRQLQEDVQKLIYYRRLAV